MAYNYVVTAQKPTNVTHSVTGKFTGASDLNIIIGKSTRLEIHLMTSEGLLPQHDVGIYGRIGILEFYHPVNQPTGFIFLCTERFQFCILGYDAAKKEIYTKACGNIKDNIGRASQVRQIGSIDPDCRLIGMHLYEGYYKVIPMTNDGSVFSDSFNIRLDELKIIDIKFLYGYKRPTICVLYYDFSDARHIKTYELLLKEKEFTDGPWSQPNVEVGANMLIPIPSQKGGVLIIGQQTIVFYNGTTCWAIPIETTRVEAYGRIDPDGSRYLIADYHGHLHVIALEKENDHVTGLHHQVIGTTSIASTVNYLDNGVVFIGSSFGDSQLIKLNREEDSSQSYISTLDSYMNIGPIQDFCVLDLDRFGQGQVITCSGAYRDGSLRVIRNGIGINEQATIELAGIKGMWSLRDSFLSTYDSYLVQSFVSEIRILAIRQEELEEAEIGGFSHEKTLYCGNVIGDMWIQVIEQEIRLISCVSPFQCCFTWKSPLMITVAHGNPSQVVVSTTGGNLIYLEIQEHGELVEVSHLTLENEISSINVTPLPITCLKTQYCAVGLWTDISVILLELPSFKILKREHLGGDTLPRSILFSRFEETDYLLVGLGDGHLLSYHFDTKDANLTEKKNVSLGIQPVSLSSFHLKGTYHVFASSDRPTVLYSNNNKLLYSNVNMREVSLMCSFHSESFPECLALTSEEQLVIGTINDIQKLHIQKIPLHEQPRRICHHESSRSLCVCTISFTVEEGDEVECGWIRLLDDQTFELLHSHKIDPFEFACSMISTKFNGNHDCFIIVGTAYAHEEEAEPHQGRILVFSVEGEGFERKLSLVAEKETRGAVYCLNGFNGKLLAGVNSKTQLYKWHEKEGEKELISECGHHGHILVLFMKSRGDFIVVGDLMKSISLLCYKALDGSIEEIARDLNSNWMTCIEILDDEIFLGAESMNNIFTLKRNSEATCDEERGKLEIQGEYHLGEFVNKFQHGSLAMQPPEMISSTSIVSKTVLFGTVNGVIGVIVPITLEKYNVLLRIQKAINTVIKGIGSFSHDEWRTFDSDRKVTPATNFIDGDLIESFLDLKHESMELVVKRLADDNMAVEGDEPLTLGELTQIIEDMAQIH